MVKGKKYYISREKNYKKDGRKQNAKIKVNFGEGEV